MNTDQNEIRHLTIDELKNGVIKIEETEEEKEKLILIQEEFKQGIDAVKEIGPSVTFYGSSRLTEDNPSYIKAQNLAYRIGKELKYAIVSGGGRGIMEAANRGAQDAGVESVGLTIRLPREQHTNQYVTKEIPFHFFFARQVSMSYTTEVCIFCTGGTGTMYEFFEILTLLQTGKIGTIPVILYGTEFWNPLIKVMREIFVEKYKTIDPKDMDRFIVTDDEDLIIDIIKKSKMRDGEDSLIE